jgi:metal-responsive CopG/Arc/MetJ family transcriptional regulator
MYTLKGFNMIRTQIYLTDKQRAELSVIAKNLGKKQSEIIREAIDRLIDQSGHNRRESALQEAAGIWKNRKDLPDFRTLRSEWDR